MGFLKTATTIVAPGEASTAPAKSDHAIDPLSIVIKGDAIGADEKIAAVNEEWRTALREEFEKFRRNPKDHYVERTTIPKPENEPYVAFFTAGEAHFAFGTVHTGDELPYKNFFSHLKGYRGLREFGQFLIYLKTGEVVVSDILIGGVRQIDFHREVLQSLLEKIWRGRIKSSKGEKIPLSDIDEIEFMHSHPSPINFHVLEENGLSYWVGRSAPNIVDFMNGSAFTSAIYHLLDQLHVPPGEFKPLEKITFTFSIANISGNQVLRFPNISKPENPFEPFNTPPGHEEFNNILVKDR